MTLRLAILGEPVVLERFLSLEEDTRARDALRSLRQFLDDFRPYATLTRNYEEFDSAMAQFDANFISSKLALRTMQSIDIVLLEANRLLMNLLASARSFLDITAKRLKRVSPAAHKRFLAWTSLMFDESLSYRIGDNLRDVAQHRDVPLRALHAARELLTDGTYSASHELLIDRLGFAMAGIQAKVRDELLLESGNIPIRPVMMEYCERLDILQLVALRETLGPYRDHAAFISKLLAEVGNPRETPLYFLDQEGELDPENLFMRLVDAHAHAIAQIQHADSVIADFDFAPLDDRVRLHPRWPK
jgi:hypothetical protein